MEMKIFNIKGEATGKMKISKDIFGQEIQSQSMFDSVLAENASQRQGTHSTKTKGEVSGGGKKPWAQKHTGNARQGSTRSPQWRKGGIVFGPRPTRNYTITLNKKAAKGALRSALATKINAKELLIVDNLNIKTYSTKQILELIKILKIDVRKVLFITDQENLFLSKSVANLQNMYAATSSTTSVKDILHSDITIIEEAAMKKYEEALK